VTKCTLSWVTSTLVILPASYNSASAARLVDHLVVVAAPAVPLFSATSTHKKPQQHVAIISTSWILVIIVGCCWLHTQTTTRLTTVAKSSQCCIQIPACGTAALVLWSVPRRTAPPPPPRAPAISLNIRHSGQLTQEHFLTAPLSARQLLFLSLSDVLGIHVYPGHLALLKHSDDLQQQRATSVCIVLQARVCVWGRG
jgi:hypothetical protein